MSGSLGSEVGSSGHCYGVGDKCRWIQKEVEVGNKPRTTQENMFMTSSAYNVYYSVKMFIQIITVPVEKGKGYRFVMSNRVLKAAGVRRSMISRRDAADGAKGSENRGSIIVFPLPSGQ